MQAAHSPNATTQTTPAATPVTPIPESSSSECHIYELPNELILHILSLLRTNELLPLTPVSQRLHALIVRLLHNRLSLAACSSNALILECYPPSQKLTAPALDCLYLSTPGIATCVSHSSSPATGRLSALRSLYSRFRPQRRDHRRFSRTIPGDIPGSRTHASSVAVTQAKWQAEREEERVRQMLSLEGHELFVQLEGNLHLVRQMGFIQNLVAVHEGYVRIWRDWLGSRADADARVYNRFDGNVFGGDEGGSSSSADVENEASQVPAARLREHESILWLDSTKNVGLKVVVQQKKWRRNVPILMYADEEISASYEITYEELLVRTSHLALVLEKSAQLEDSNTAKAVVFGTFR